MSDCHFFISIYAPLGLSGIDKHMHLCKLPLKPYLSGYNDKIVLRHSGSEDWFEWNMDSADGDVLVAHGDISLLVNDAWQLLETLGIALTASGLPHKLGLDDESGNMKYESSYLWEKD